MKKHHKAHPPVTGQSNAGHPHPTSQSHLGKSLLTQEEELAILRALSRGTGSGFTKAEACRVLEWANNLRFGEAFLELVLNGLCKVSIRDDGELEFGVVVPQDNTPGRSPAPSMQ